MELKINNIKPTIFFAKRKSNIYQVVDVSITNISFDRNAELRVEDLSTAPVATVKTNLRVKKGEHWYRIYLPELHKDEASPVELEFLLFSGDGRNKKLEDKKHFLWKPKRHWQVYLIHLAHHDLGYTDLPSSVLREYEGFFDKIIEFCEKTENFPKEAKFRYVVEQSWSILHYIKNRPASVVNKLIKYIKEGRVEVTAFFGNLITELCSYEELIRSLYPSFYIKRKYNIPIQVAYLNDITGLSWGIAAVLSSAGVKYFSPYIPRWYYKDNKGNVHPYWDETKVLPIDTPGVFRWESADSNSIVFWSEPEPYLYLWSYEQAISEIEPRLNLLEERNYPFDIVKYVVLGGARDNSPPLLRLSYIVKEWNTRWAYPKLILATNTLFFRVLERKYENFINNNLPVVRGELPCSDYVVGATSTAKETGINRVTHERLHSAEKFATIASKLTDYPYPCNDIDDAYRNMMLYDEHTWGTCCIIGPAQDAHRNEKEHFAYIASAKTHNILFKALNRIADKIKLANDDNTYIIVFNSLSFPRTDIVQVPVKEFAPHELPMYTKSADPYPILCGAAIGRDVINLPPDVIEKNYKLLDLETNSEVPYQINKVVYPDTPSPYSEHRHALEAVDRSYAYDLLFVAKNVPPMGYKTYKLVPITNKKLPICTNNIISEKGNVLENKFYRVVFNRKGVIESIYDKELRRKLVDANAKHKFNQVVIYYPLHEKEEVGDSIDVKCRCNGAVSKSLLTYSRASCCPRIIQEVVLYNDIKRIDFNTKILKDSTALQEFYIAFPFLLNSPQFRFENAGSVIEPLKEQFPGSNTSYYSTGYWVSGIDTSDGTQIVLSCIDSSLVEFGGLQPNRISYAHHAVTPSGFKNDAKRIDKFNKGHIYSCIMVNNFRTNFSPVQSGEVLFRYSITSCKKDNDTEIIHAYRFGCSVRNPVMPVCVKGNNKNEATLKPSLSFCQLDKDNVILLTLKRAEDGKGIILRLLEIQGISATVTIFLPYINIIRAYQTNVVEENEKVIHSRKHTLKVDLKPFSLVTIRVIC